MPRHLLDAVVEDRLLLDSVDEADLAPHDRQDGARVAEVVRHLEDRGEEGLDLRIRSEEGLLPDEPDHVLAAGRGREGPVVRVERPRVPPACVVRVAQQCLPR